MVDVIYRPLADVTVDLGQVETFVTADRESRDNKSAKFIHSLVNNRLTSLFVVGVYRQPRDDL